MRFSRINEVLSPDRLDGQIGTLEPLGAGTRPAAVLMGGEGYWQDAVAGAQSLELWVMARDLAAVAAAGEAAVGAVFAALSNPDSAAELTAAYEAALASHRARAVAATATTGCAVRTALPEQLEDAVGLVERYRQAGVDMVVVDGPRAEDATWIQRLAAEFDDDEVRGEAEARAQRMESHARAAEARTRAAQAGGPPAPRKPERAEGGPARGRRMAGFVQRRGEALVGQMSDRQLDRFVGTSLGVRTLMRSMASRFRPDKAAGFVGAIEFSLQTSRGTAIWTIDCGLDAATARKGPEPGAALHVAAEIADFLRIGTGELAAPAAVLTGQLHVRGDFGLALRMGEMFDGPAIV